MSSKGTSIGEFFVSILVDAAKGELTVNNLIKSMGMLEVVSVGEIAILGDLANRLMEITEASIHSAHAFNDYTAATGGSTEALQKWQSVAAHVGVSGEEVQSVMAGISQSLVGLNKFGVQSELANLLQPLHMSLDPSKYKEPEQLLESIRNSPIFQKMDAATKLYTLSKAHLGSLVRVLSKDEAHGGISDAEFRRFASEAGTMPIGDIHRYHYIYSDLVSIEKISTRIGQVIASWISPRLLASLDKFVAIFGAFADVLDNRSKPTTLGLAGSAALASPTSIMDRLQKGTFISGKDAALTVLSGLGNLGRGLQQMHSNLVEPILGAGAGASSHRTNYVTLSPVVNINGTSLSHAELSKATHDALNRAFQGLPAQLALGPL